MEFFAGLTPGTAVVMPVLIGAALLGVVFIVGDRDEGQRRAARRAYLEANGGGEGLPEFSFTAGMPKLTPSSAAPQAAKQPEVGAKRSDRPTTQFREEFFHSARLADVKPGKPAKAATKQAATSGSVRAHLRKAEETAARPKSTLSRAALANHAAARSRAKAKTGNA